MVAIPNPVRRRRQVLLSVPLMCVKMNSDQNQRDKKAMLITCCGDPDPVRPDPQILTGYGSPIHAEYVTIRKIYQYFSHFIIQVQNISLPLGRILFKDRIWSK
jgi:hypothetical protein